MSREKVLALVDELCTPIPEAEWKYYDDYHGRCLTHDEPLLPLIGCVECNNVDKEFEDKISELKLLIKYCRRGY